MVDYRKEVESEAKDFIDNHEDDIKESILEGNTDIDDVKPHGGLYEDFREECQPSYDLEDAAFVIKNCDNEESDSGIWEGQEPEDAIISKAIYSFQNDVWEKIREIFEEMVSEYENQIADLEDEHSETEESETVEEDEEKAEEEKKKIMDAIFKEYIQEKEVTPVEKGSEEEKELIERWFRMQKEAGMWGGYPVGSSYIDARCGAMFTEENIKDFVDFDHELAKKVPHLSGKYKEAVMEYYVQTFGDQRDFQITLNGKYLKVLADFLKDNPSLVDLPKPVGSAELLKAVDTLSEAIVRVSERELNKASSSW